MSWNRRSSFSCAPSCLRRSTSRTWPCGPCRRAVKRGPAHEVSRGDRRPPERDPLNARRQPHDRACRKRALPFTAARPSTRSPRTSPFSSQGPQRGKMRSLVACGIHPRHESATNRMSRPQRRAPKERPAEQLDALRLVHRPAVRIAPVDGGERAVEEEDAHGRR
jgi:hypothetical protein